MCEVKKVYEGVISKVFTKTDNNLCVQKSNVSFHIYMSLTPCK